MLMKSEVEIKQQDWQNALKTLEFAYDLPGVKDPTLPPGKKYTLPLGQ